MFFRHFLTKFRHFVKFMIDEKGFYFKIPEINFKTPFLDVSDNLLNIYRLENIY